MRVRVFGKFICAGCGRRIPYLWREPAFVTTDPDKARVLCFRCAASERLREAR